MEKQIADKQEALDKIFQEFTNLKAEETDLENKKKNS